MLFRSAFGFLYHGSKILKVLLGPREEKCAGLDKTIDCQNFSRLIEPR